MTACATCPQMLETDHCSLLPVLPVILQLQVFDWITKSYSCCWRSQGGMFSSLRCLQTLHVPAGVRLGTLENILKGAALHHTNVPFGDCSLTGSRFVKGRLSEVKAEYYFLNESCLT